MLKHRAPNSQKWTSRVEPSKSRKYSPDGCRNEHPESAPAFEALAKIGLGDGRGNRIQNEALFRDQSSETGSPKAQPKMSITCVRKGFPGGSQAGPPRDPRYHEKVTNAGTVLEPIRSPERPQEETLKIEAMRL